MKYYAVIDTNVLVSALLTKNVEAATFKIMEYLFSGSIIPLYCKEIICEYKEVLSRSRFHFDSNTVRNLVDRIEGRGVETELSDTDEFFPDASDAVFYQVAVTGQNKNAHLVNGNLRHYPLKTFVVSPAEMLQIIENG